MTGYDADAATLQMFIDCVIRGLTAHSDPGGGHGHGWHLVELDKLTDTLAVLTFETPTPLIGWKPEQREPYPGPHRVSVTVEAKPLR